MFFMLGIKKYLGAIVVAALVADVIIGSIMLANTLADEPIASKGLRFGFYTVDETKG